MLFYDWFLIKPILLNEKKSQSYSAWRYKYVYKYLDVGKTSILQVLLHGSFQDKMANTLGACFHRYECEDGRG